MNRALQALAAAVALVLAGAALAQTPSFPSKPIRLVVPYPAGGPLDTAARGLAERLKESLGTVVVENRPGAGGNLGVDQVAKSPPDGYTLVIGAVATHAVNPWLFSKLPYDPIKDFVPITLIAHVPNVLVMTPERAAQLKIASARDLFEYLRRNPGQLNYASGGNGSAGHMAGELLKSQAGVSAVHIPYAGAGPAQLGLLAGQIDFMFDNLASATGQIKAGKLKALAVTTPQRRAFAAGRTDDGRKWRCRASTSRPGSVSLRRPALRPPIVARLNESMTAALRTPEMRERLARMGAEPAPMSSAAVRAAGPGRTRKVRKGREVLRRTRRLRPSAGAEMQNQGRQGLLVRSHVRRVRAVLRRVCAQYDMGTAARMGPAYFPTVLGGLLLAARCARRHQGTVRRSTGRPVDRFHFKPLRAGARRGGAVRAAAATGWPARCAGGAGDHLESGQR